MNDVTGNSASLPQTPRPLRVLMLLENESYPDDIRVQLEASCLHEAGCQVTVICPSGLSRRTYENVAGVHVYRYPRAWELNGFLGYMWEYGYSLAMMFVISLYVLVRRGFDVVHVHTPPDMLVAVAGFYKLLGKRYVMDHHDLSPELYQARAGGAGNRLVVAALRWFERLSCRTADCLIATNESQRRVQIERCGAEPGRCRVVRNGPDARYLAPIASPAAPKDGRITIGYVGMIGVQDRLDILMRVIDCLLNRRGRSDFRAVVVGAGPALADVKRLCDELRLGSHVSFAGYCVGVDLFRHLASFDICVTPDPSNPYNDSCTMIKMMEYMALAKPIVAFDLPEHRISAADAALYAGANDVGRFAECIEMLMDSPALRAEMGRRGRERVESQLSWERQRGKLLDAYRSLLAPEAVRAARESSGKSKPCQSSAFVESTSAGAVVAGVEVRP